MPNRITYVANAFSKSKFPIQMLNCLLLPAQNHYYKGADSFCTHFRDSLCKLVTAEFAAVASPSVSKVRSHEERLSDGFIGVKKEISTDIHAGDW